MSSTPIGAKGTLVAALLIAAISIGLAAFAPSVRSEFKRVFSVYSSSKNTLALNECTLTNGTKNTDPDRIYFLSCGGIY